MVAIISRGAIGLGGNTAGRHVALGSRRWFVGHWPGGAVGNDPLQVWRNIDAFHRNTQRWAVIGYNYGIARDGRILEGAGLMVRGVHSPPRNTDGFGVCFLVAPGEALPQAMRNSARALYDWLNRQAGRTLGRAGHSTHWATSCPGPAVLNWINSGMPSTGGQVPPPPPGPPPVAGVPRFDGTILRQPPIMRRDSVRTWQTRVRARPDLPQITVDGAFGPQSEGAARRVQEIARLPVDGRVGANTWPATWTTGANAIGGGAAGGGDQMASAAFWRNPSGGPEETHRVFRRSSDNAIMYSRNGGPYQRIAGLNARGAVDIAASPSGWLLISYVNMQGRVCEARSAPGFGPWSWHEMGGPA